MEPMDPNILCRLVIGLAVGLQWVGSAVGAPPRVVRAAPDMADVGVDPALKEIVVEFDQDMAVLERSICGGGPTMPKLEGNVRWTSPRRVVVPVRLEAGRRYALSINCASAMNFRGVNGEAAEVYPIAFVTAAEGERESRVLTAEQAAEALARLRKGIDERYAYRDLRAERGLDWAELLKQAGPGIAAARTPGELGRRVAAMLRATGDMHIGVRVSAGEGEEPFVLAAGRREVARNVDNTLLRPLLRGWRMLGPHAAGGEYRGIPVLVIAGWGGAEPEYAEVMEFLEEHKGASRFIIDVRSNSGGDELIARRVAGWFVGKPAVYSKNRIRDPAWPGGVDGWSPVFERVVQPKEGASLRSAKTAVLIGAAVMSSCESFVLMMKHGAGSMLIGAATFGSSGRPLPLELAPGVSVTLPSWVDMRPDGTVVEGAGIVPDIETLFTGKGGRDEVLESAAEVLLAEPTGDGPR